VSLWACPRCGAKLVAQNGSHACGAHSVEQFLAGAPPLGRELFELFVELIARCGPYEIAPAKTRVAFMAKVRFASVNRVGRQGIDIHFVLPRRLSNPRFSRVEKVDRVFVHHLRLTSEADLDAELFEWLARSYVEYGERTWLAAKRRSRVTRAKR
jgi:hypothetical protein